VQFRLTGKYKARVATRLALVQLLDRKPLAALATLDTNGGPTASKSGNGDIDPTSCASASSCAPAAPARIAPCRRGARHSRADNSVEADSCAPTSIGAGKNWTEAAKTFARLTGAARMPEGQLDEDVARTILNWGTALTLADDRPGIAKLAATYGAAMRRAPSATPSASSPAAARRAPAISPARRQGRPGRRPASFMASYREPAGEAEAERDELGETPPGGGFRL